MDLYRDVKFKTWKFYTFKLRRYVRPLKVRKEIEENRAHHAKIKKLGEYLHTDEALLDDKLYEEGRQFAANNGWSYDYPVQYRREAEKRARLKELFGAPVDAENILESVRLLVDQSFFKYRFKEAYTAHRAAVVAFAHGWFLDLIKTAYNDTETYELVKRLMTVETKEYEFIWREDERSLFGKKLDTAYLTVVGQMRFLGVNTSALNRAYNVLIGDKEPVVTLQDFVGITPKKYGPGEFRRHIAVLLNDEDSWRLWHGQLALAQHDTDPALQREAGYLCQRLQEVIVRRQAQITVG